MTSRTKMFFLVSLILILICPALAWTPFLNDYTPPGAAIYADRVIADTINEFILYRLQSGQYSSPMGCDFSYSRPSMLDPYPTFDHYGRLYAQRDRFPQLSNLARERLEMHGLQVRRLQIFEHRNGIYIKWDIVDPFLPTGWDASWRETHANSKQEARSRNSESGKSDGENVCHGKSESICRLKSFFRDPKEFFRHYWD
jgi:hypothetical protein